MTARKPQEAAVTAPDLDAIHRHLLDVSPGYRAECEANEGSEPEPESVPSGE